MQGKLYANVITLGSKVENVFVERGLLAIEVFNKSANAAFVFEDVSLVGSLVAKGDAYTGVKERQLAQTLGENLVMELGVGKDFRAGMEADASAGFIRLADFFQRRLRLAQVVFLLVLEAFAVDGQLKLVGKRVHHRNANPVQATGYLVGVVVELAAGVQHREDNLGCGAAFFFVDADRDTTAVIRNAD